MSLDKTNHHTLLSLLTVALVLAGLTATAIRVQAQTLVEPPPNSSAPSSNQCSKVGSNFAVPFEYRPPESAMTEANFALLSVSSFANIDEYMTTIKTWVGASNPLGSSRRVIIRIGASKDDVGPSAEEYARILNHVAETYPVIAMVSHNEPNGQEATALCNAAGGAINICTADIDSPGLFEQKRTIVLNYERTFASRVVSLVASPNVTFIAGQVDNYFNSSGSVDNSRAIEFAAAMLRVSPRITGVSLPVYITSGFPDAISAVALYDRTVQGIRAAAGRDFDVYVTESGPYLNQQDTFQQYLDALQAIIAKPNLKAFLLFNSHGFNPDPSFTYTRPFWNELCRQALRTSCFDDQTVIQACSAFGERTCRNFCKGDSSDPCKLTPLNDCSMPFPVNDVLSKNVSEVRKQEVVSYLYDYLPFTKLSKGVFFEHAVQTTGAADFCSRAENANHPKCVTSDGFESISVAPEGNLNYLTPVPDEFLLNVPLRLQEAASAFSNPTSRSETLEDLGINQKKYSFQELIYRLSDLANLKEECFQRGRVMESLPTSFFGKIRCMNYQEWDSCPIPGQCQYSNEQELFNKGLASCREMIKTSGLDRQVKYRQCREEYNSLLLGDLAHLNSLPPIPKARRPIIFVHDFTSAQATQNDWAVSEINQIGFSGFDFFNQFSPQAPANQPPAPDLAPADRRTITQYMVGEQVIGDDTFQATDMFSTTVLPYRLYQNLKRNALIPTISPADFDEFLTGGVITDQIIEFFSSETPFSRNRIPEDIRYDHRYIMIQLLANRRYMDCRQPGGQEDGIGVESTIDLFGDSGILNWAVKELAKFFNVFNFLASNQKDPNAFIFDQIVSCAIYPKSVEVANTLNSAATSYLLPFRENDAVAEVDQRQIVSRGQQSATLNVGNQDDLECYWTPQPGKNPITPGDPVKDPCGYITSNGITIGPMYCNEQCDRSVQFVTTDNKTEHNRDYNSFEANLGVNNLLAYRWYLPYKDSCKLDTHLQCTNSNQTTPTPSCSFQVDVAASAPPSQKQMAVQSPSLQALLVKAANQYQVPVDTLLTALYIENCRSTTIYNGESASVCVKSEEFLKAGNYLAPRVEYPHTNMCTLPGSGTDQQANTNGTDDAKGVFQFYHNIFADNACDINFDGKCDTQDIELGAKTVNWGYSRIGLYDNVCSIHDSTYAAAKTLAEKVNKNPGSWTLQDKQSALMYWALGVADPNLCASGNPFAEMYCDTIEDLQTPGGVFTFKSTCD